MSNDYHPPVATIDKLPAHVQEQARVFFEQTGDEQKAPIDESSLAWGQQDFADGASWAGRYLRSLSTLLVSFGNQQGLAPDEVLDLVLNGLHKSVERIPGGSLERMYRANPSLSHDVAKKMVASYLNAQ